MFPPWKERELQKVQTSNDDDDAGGYEKPDLDCIIGASLVDDLGANSAVLERLFRFYRTWRHSRANDRYLGRSQNLHPIQMARSQVKSEVGMPTLSSDG